jgi:hypothetical protein
MSIFWAVPVLTFSFSLIYCVAVVIGVLTRSTVFSLLGALLFWGATLIAQWTEDAFYKMAYVLPEAGLQVDFSSGEIRDSADDPTNSFEKSYVAIRSMTSLLPKTRECTLSLKRLIHFQDRDSLLSGVDLSSLFIGEELDPVIRDAMAKYEQRHSWFSLYGTSAIFELLVLSLAAIVFARRDY